MATPAPPWFVRRAGGVAAAAAGRPALPGWPAFATAVRGKAAKNAARAAASGGGAGNCCNALLSGQGGGKPGIRAAAAGCCAPDGSACNASRCP